MSDYQVHIVDSIHGMEALSEDWNKLVFRLPGTTPFQTFDWAWAWWNAYGKGARGLLVISFRQSGRTVGIIPLAIGLRNDGADEAVFLGLGPSDYLDWLVPEGEAKILLTYLCRVLISLGINHLNLTDIPANSSFLTAVREAVHNSEVEAVVEPHEFNSYIELPEAWLTYLHQRTHNTREAIRRAYRRISLLGGVELSFCSSEKTLPEYLQVFLDLHFQWWSSRQRETVLAAVGATDFLINAIDRLMRLGMLQLSVRRCLGEPVSAFIILAHRSTRYYYLSAANPAYEHVSPGVGHMAELLRHAIDGGVAIFDLLRGDELYKRRWATNETSTWRCRGVLT